MKYYPSALYNSPIPDIKKQIRKSFIKGLSQKKQNPSTPFFFRADDIGVPSRLFNEMVALFINYKIPLCLAVVPTWLTGARFKALRQKTGKSSQFCWHQHGWLHRNHELLGKKQEFGENRCQAALKKDLVNGKGRLQDLLKDKFSPFFTPPWNRCSSSTLILLEELQFKGVSRSLGALPNSPPGFPDFQINVDLHTRKERNKEESLHNLLEEIERSLATEITGVMLHHQRMNSNALHLLEALLQVLTEFKEIRPVQFNEMV